MITVNNYSLRLGYFSLTNINLNINDGEIFAVIGETGSGKTVLLESMAGLHKPDSGVVDYNNIPVRNIPLKDRNIGFVYQDFSLFPHMTVRNNIEFGLKMKKISKNERHEIGDVIMEKLKITHLMDNYPGTLSGGEKQRTALARAIVLEPDILFMDEPFSALDPVTRTQMYHIIKNVHKSYNCTIVFVTHNFNDAIFLADRIGIMIKGNLRVVCSAEELFSQNFDSDIKDFLGKDCI